MAPGMPLESVHILLTYRCIYECPHCFLHCGPGSQGTLTLFELEGLLAQAGALEGVKGVWFEGGEPALYYPLLQRGVQLATAEGLRSGLVTCGFFATSVRDGELWLGPLKEAGLAELNVSVDELHGRGEPYTHAMNLLQAAQRVGIAASVISVCDPRKAVAGEATQMRLPGPPVPSYLRGRAAHELVEGMPTRPWTAWDECDLEDLEAPRRVHVDPYGNVHVCQGILAGNVWETSLAHIVRGYEPHAHPVVGPLVEGGPAELVRRLLPGCTARYASACHACYEARRSLRPRLRAHLGPSQVYGEEPDPPPTTYV